MLIPLLTLPLLGLAALILPGSRALAAVVAAMAFVPPCWPQAPSLLRLFCAIGAVAGFARVLDVEPTAPAYERVLRVLTVVDWRTARRARPRLDGRALAMLVVHAAVATAAIAALFRTRPGALWPGWLLGATAIWALAEATNALVLLLTAAGGVTLARLHDAPLSSRSLAEMWGRRWNLTVTRWLHRRVFQPLARRGHARLGVLATFGVSAVFHAYLAGAAGGTVCALSMGAFFVVQGLLVVLERALRLSGRAWFLAAVLVPSPLFVEPMIAITRPSASPLPCLGSKMLPDVLHE